MNDFKFFQKETANNSLGMVLEQIMEDRRHFPGYERVEIRGDMVTLNEGIDNE
jgi:hypothetical protein